MVKQNEGCPPTLRLGLTRVLLKLDVRRPVMNNVAALEVLSGMGKGSNVQCKGKEVAERRRLVGRAARLVFVSGTTWTYRTILTRPKTLETPACISQRSIGQPAVVDDIS